MPILKNVKHEKFCQLVASGMALIDAYKECYPKCTTDNSASVGANDLMKRADVSERIKELQTQFAEKCIITKEEKEKILSQEIRSKGKDWLQSIQEHNKMAGHHAPTKTDNKHSGEGLVLNLNMGGKKNG